MGVLGALLALAGTLPRLLPHILSVLRDDIVFRVSPRLGNCTVYLTIDDGPSEQTPAILAILKRHHVHATFFITTDHIHDAAQIDAITEAGHALGNHLPTTKAASQLTLAEFKRDFDRAAAVLEQYHATRLVRLPSNFGTRAQTDYVRAQGCTVVAGTVFPLDHAIADATWTRRLAEWLTIDGGVIILHDGRERGRRTAEVLDRLIPDLQARGFAFGDLAAALPDLPVDPQVAASPQ